MAGKDLRFPVIAVSIVVCYTLSCTLNLAAQNVGSVDGHIDTTAANDPSTISVCATYYKQNHIQACADFPKFDWQSLFHPTQLYFKFPALQSGNWTISVRSDGKERIHPTITVQPQRNIALPPTPITWKRVATRRNGIMLASLTGSRPIFTAPVVRVGRWRTGETMSDEAGGSGSKLNSAFLPDGIIDLDAARRIVFDAPLMETLPIPGIRTFDSFALLRPGVLPPPETNASAGPGISAGVGSAGQFVVNGLRSRDNNFMIDGSDNNEEDVGVRRQGFVALAPQPIESVDEFQIVTALGDARFGRNIRWRRQCPHQIGRR